MTYRCPKVDCDFESPTKQGLAGHIAGHKKRGELPKERVHAYSGTKEVVPTPHQIADALLLRVVDVIKAGDLKDAQIKSARKQIADLESDVKRLQVETDRLLKIHNEQAKRGVLTSSDELIRLARR